MSINGVDYTKQLSSDREFFQDANKKLREASDKRVEDTNKRADHVMEKQRENFIEDKAELETSYKKNLDNLKNKTHEFLEGNNAKTNNELQKERENFTQESLKKSKDFDQRLNDIKTSYSKKFSSENEKNENRHNSQRKKYAQNIEDIRQKSHEQLKNYQHRMTGAGANLKDQYSRERQQLVRSQEDRITEQSKDSANKREELKSRIDSENKKLQEVQTTEVKNQKQYMQNRMQSMQKKFQDRYDIISKDFSQRSQNVSNSQQMDAIRSNRELQDQLIETRRKYNENLRLIDLEKRRNGNGTGDSSVAAIKQQGLTAQTMNKNKIRNLQDRVVETQREYQNRANNEQKAFNIELREAATNATNRTDRKVNELNANHIVSTAKEKEKLETEIDNRENQSSLVKISHDQQIILERQKAKEQVGKLKENFNASMKAIEDNHNAGMEDVTKANNEDKSRFIKNFQKTRSQEMFEMKRKFGKVMDATVQNYEQRLANYQRDTENLKMTMNQKIVNILDQTEKKLESQRNLFEDRRTADIKGQQILMDERENQLKNNFNQMNHTYQKKIDKMQVENDTKLKLITNDYETRLKELKALTTRELAMKHTSQQIELDRIKQAYEEEKIRVVNSYESELEAVKKVHKDQIVNYKRLS